MLSNRNIVLVCVAVVCISATQDDTLLVPKKHASKKISEEQLKDALFAGLQDTIDMQSQLLAISKQCIDCSTSQKQRKGVLKSIQLYREAIHDIQREMQLIF